MKTNTKTILALFALGLLIACKNGNYDENASIESEAKAVETDSSTTSNESDVISSSAAVENKNSTRKFVRTADVRFQVKNVAKSTTKIEDATTKFGGFVTYTDLESHINSVEKTKVSPDSTLTTTRYSVDNSITIRVPNTQLDTVLRLIAKEVHFLNHRKISANDVTLQMLSNQLAQKRNATTQKRVEKAIDEKGKKLTQVIDAEENLAAKKEQNDNTLLQNLSLEDQVNFSTLTLEIYQDETIKQEMIANEKSINAYRPNIGLQIWDSLKTGWFILEKILSFIVVLWPFILIGSLGWLGYKKYLKK
ncbi:MAG: DUF4349 domain-containing protein [Flavobacterium sp.]|nr:DUF4349 domain-containing protein [Flavobacterium sp.]